MFEHEKREKRERIGFHDLLLAFLSFSCSNRTGYFDAGAVVGVIFSGRVHAYNTPPPATTMY